MWSPLAGRPPSGRCWLMRSRWRWKTGIWRKIYENIFGDVINHQCPLRCGWRRNIWFNFKNWRKSFCPQALPRWNFITKAIFKNILFWHCWTNSAMNRFSRQHFFEMFLIIMKILTLLAKLFDRVYFENVFVIMEIMTSLTRLKSFLLSLIPQH